MTHSFAHIPAPVDEEHLLLPSEYAVCREIRPQSMDGFDYVEQSLNLGLIRLCNLFDSCY